MLETASTRTDLPVGFPALNLEEKYRRVINRHDRLGRLRAMPAPGIVVRNERRMLKAAVDNLFDDAEVEAIVTRFGLSVFSNYLNYISGTEIEPPSAKTAAASLVA